MARVLIVERAGRAAGLVTELTARAHAVRTVDDEPLLPGHVVGAFENVTILCWLMGAGDRLDSEVNGRQLETVLLRSVDSGIRGVVFERPAGIEANAHIEHASATWHIPIEEVDAGTGAVWAGSVADAVDRLLGITPASRIGCDDALP